VATHVRTGTSAGGGVAPLKTTAYVPVGVLLLASCFFVYDIGNDFVRGDEGLVHIGVEALVFAAIGVALLMELRRVAALRRSVSDEQDKTARLSGELLAVMRRQFERWQLSPSESEIALLMIKGLSMREIAQARDVKEKTVRQQATSIYAKSGYAGRHELAAHFIEDLMNDSGIVAVSEQEAP
jgi:DNA-binding CsgD family transcriptional regulator